MGDPTLLKLSGATNIEEFDCAEGLGIRISQGGRELGAARMSIADGRELVKRLAARVGLTRIFGVDRTE